MNEVKIRVPVSFHRAINLAASKRGVAASALVSMVVYEYLQRCGELAPAPVSVAPAADMSVWHDDD